METTPTMPLVIIAKGEIVQSNFPEFAAAVRARLAEFNTNLRTDEDFEQAASDSKVIAGAEAELKSAKLSALAQAEKLNELFSQIDDLTGELAKARLAMTKQINDRREEIKAEIVKSALTQLTCDPSMRNGYTSALMESVKGKRSFEAMREAVRVAVNIANDAIGRSRALLDEFVTAHGTDLVMDRRTLETTDPVQVAAELRRRLEARDAEREKAKLREAAAIAQKEAHEARKAAERVNVPQNVPTQPQAAEKPNPATVTDLPWDGAKPTIADQNEADELEQFLALVVAQFTAIKEARVLLCYESNRMAAAALAKAVNDWYQVNKKGLKP